MTRSKRLLFAMAAATAVFIEGCSCSSDNNKTTPVPTPQPEPGATFELSGKASKGILIGATVSAYAIVDGDVDTSKVVATAVTDQSGAYVLEIPEEVEGTPLVVRVTPSESGTEMRCDLPAGCGDSVTFGQNISLASDSGLVLDAVVPSVQPTVTTNVTFLTNLAAGVALEAIDSLTADAIQAEIIKANSQIANRFGIIGDLTQVPVVDVTDASAVAAVVSEGNSAAVRYASLNAGIVQAVMADGAESIAASVSAFREAFAQNGGIAGNTADPADTGLDEILAAARAVIAAVEASSEEDLDLSAIDAEIATDQEFAANEEPDRFDPGVPSENSGKSELEIVKAMVSDLRDLTVTIGDASLSGDDTVASVTEAFGLQMEAAEVATSADAMAAIQGLAMAANAISEAYTAFENDPELKQIKAINGINVTIDSSEDTAQFAVKQEVSVADDDSTYSVSLDLTAVRALDYQDSSEGENITVSGSASFNIHGSASTDAVSLAINEGSKAVVADLSVAAEEDSAKDTEKQTHSLGEVSLALDLGVAQKASATVTDPLAISGKLLIAIKNVAAEVMESGDDGELALTLGTVTLQFSGSAENTTGEKYRFAFVANGDAAGVNYSDIWSGDSSEVTAEDDDTYAAFSTSLQFTADLAGKLNAVAVKLGANRTGQDDGALVLSLTYPGKKIVVESSIIDAEISKTVYARNQDGVKMTVTETEVDGDFVISGTISLNGTDHATIATGENGLVTITYTDGSFETL